MPDPGRDELQQLGRAFGAFGVGLGQVDGAVQDVDPRIADVEPSVEILLNSNARRGT